MTPSDAARSLLKAETARARRGARPAVLLGLGALVLAVVQAGAAALALAAALEGRLAGTAIAVFAVAALLRAGLGIASELRGVDAGAAARRRLRTEGMARVLGTPASGVASGDLAAALADGVEAFDGLHARWAAAVIQAVAGPVLIGAVVLAADPWAGLVLLAAGLFVPAGMAVAGIGAGAAARRQFRAMSRLQARFLDRVRGLSTIVLAGRTDAEAAALQAAAAELGRRTLRVLRIAFLSSAALDLAAVVALTVLAMRYGGALLTGTLADPAAAIFVLLLVPEFFAPLRAFAAAYQDRMHASGAAEALSALPPAPVPAPPQQVRAVTARGVTIAFENVRVSYDPARPAALDGLSFRVPAGQTLVLAGPSGAGKSTVFAVLLGFVTPQSGRVTVNGAPLDALVPEARRRLIGWVGQRPHLFAATIRENIRFARPDASDAELEEAAKAARVTDFATHLPLGLDTKVGEGGYGISGGEAQRVAVARAFLRNAPLLLLDEPTAHLDPATEADLLDSLRRLAMGRTVIVASHSTAAHAWAGVRLDLRDGRAAPAASAA